MSETVLYNYCRASLVGLDMNRASAAALGNASAFMPSAVPSQTMLLPLPSSSHPLPPSSIAHFIPFDPAQPSALPTLLPLPGPNVASQHSADSTCTVIVSQQQHDARFPLPQAPRHPPLSSLSHPGTDPRAVPLPAHPAPQMAAKPAKKIGKGKKAQKAAEPASSALGLVSQPAAAAGGGGSGEVVAPVKRKRGPYKKRVKKEGEQKAPAGRKKKAISLLPAVEAFRLHGMQQQRQAVGPAAQPACVGSDEQQGPSKRAR